MRVSVSNDASLRWAIDQRSGAIGSWTFTWSNTSSSWPTDASLPQCTVSVRPRCAAQSAIVSKASLSAAVGLSLLYIPPVMRSPTPLKRSMLLPMPIGSFSTASVISSNSPPLPCEPNEKATRTVNWFSRQISNSAS